MEKYLNYKEVSNILKQMLQEPKELHKEEDWHTGVYDAMVKVCTLPIVKTEEPKHGKWEFPEYAGQTYYRCSCCGKDYSVPPTWTLDDVKKYLKYCSACGVKMD